MYKFKIVPVF